MGEVFLREDTKQLTIFEIGEERAIEYLTKRMKAGIPGLVLIRIDPLFDRLRSDGRFKQLVQRFEPIPEFQRLKPPQLVAAALRDSCTNFQLLEQPKKLSGQRRNEPHLLTSLRVTKPQMFRVKKLSIQFANLCPQPNVLHIVVTTSSVKLIADDRMLYP